MALRAPVTLRGQHGTISDDDGGTNLCQDAEPGCQSNHSALWDDKDGP